MSSYELKRNKSLLCSSQDLIDPKKDNTERSWTQVHFSELKFQEACICWMIANWNTNKIKYIFPKSYKHLIFHQELLKFKWRAIYSHVCSIALGISRYLLSRIRAFKNLKMQYVKRILHQSLKMAMLILRPIIKWSFWYLSAALSTYSQSKIFMLLSSLVK